MSLCAVLSDEHAALPATVPRALGGEANIKAQLIKCFVWNFCAGVRLVCSHPSQVCIRQRGQRSALHAVLWQGRPRLRPTQHEDRAPPAGCSLFISLFAVGA